MSDVLVRGMKMPKNCVDCDLYDMDSTQCPIYAIYKEDYSDERFGKCPLVEIPTPHGRLIDADAFEDAFNMELLPILINKYGEEEALKGLHFSFRDCICNIQAQKTVIEAEGSEI